MDVGPLPEGFRWAWAGDTVRIDLPRFVKTDKHAYEPVLSGRDADALAQALSARERRRIALGTGVKLTRILLAHDPRYAPERLSKFRARFTAALLEHGQDAALDDLVTRSGMEEEDEPGAA
jgi:hypothetical protein